MDSSTIVLYRHSRKMCCYIYNFSGLIRSHASRSYRLEGNSLEVPFTIDQTITYVECEPPMSNTRLKVARNFIVYDSQEQIVRYAMTNKISPLTGKISKYKVLIMRIRRYVNSNYINVSQQIDILWDLPIFCPIVF